MPAGRRVPLRDARLGLLLACALLLRGLIPAGWMPAGDGLSIQICADATGSTDTGFATAAQRQFEQALGPAADRKAKDRGADHPGKDQPCAFAGLATAWTGAEAPALAPPIAVAATLEPPAPAAAFVGRGLAAPPPPATGPPAFA
ncbi:MAG TPA: hypothetical protein VMG08_19085 [Allosphingosinicella sp.]|nr:hypothetical protein [Allosphingosinicella sp.]